MWSIPATHPKTVSQSSHAIVFMKLCESQTIIEVPCRRRDFPATSIPAEEHTNRSASLRSTFWWKPRRKITLHALTRANLRSDTEIHGPEHGGACNTVFTHASSSRCVCRRQAHPSTPRAPPSPKNPFFFSFSLWPLLLRFSVA